jgi:hypothetical protein
MRLIDLTGQKFGRLTVIERDKEKAKGGTKWICKCDCGKIVSVYGGNLQRGTSTSCGCYRRENPNSRKHGMSNARLYNIWSKMKNRCENPSSKFFKRYGGRGISVCEEWKDPKRFFEWSLSHGYEEGLTIDRIDNYGNYCPENCRWVDTKTQENNRGNNRYFTFNGKTQSLSMWCEELHQNYKTAYKRIFILGWDFQRAMETPIDVSKRNRLAGKTNG